MLDPIKKRVPFASQIYLRDLAPGPKAEYEREIRKQRPDLVPVLEAEEDIAIGTGYIPAEFEAV